MAVIYVFIEGKNGGSEYTFWREISRCLYKGALNIVGCGGISNVVPMLRSHQLKSVDIGLVVIDKPLDNPAILNDIMDVTEFIQSHPNYSIVDTLCFEDTMLRFKYYSAWVFTAAYRGLTHNPLDAYECLQDYINNSHWWKSARLCSFINNKYKLGVPVKGRSLHDIASDLQSRNITEERFASKLLEELTHGSSYKHNLHINKGVFGFCWYCNCSDKTKCDVYFYDARTGKYVTKIGKNATNTCGLVNNKKTGDAKVREVYAHIPLHKAILRAKTDLLNRGFGVAKILQ